jgi:2,3-diaminopropionate biosynthesis protein SbnA
MNNLSATQLKSANVLGVGSTPVVPVHCRFQGKEMSIWLKLESSNPAGSLKDRTAAYLLADLEARGALIRSSVIVESTSGNLGVALALRCQEKSRRFLAVIDPKITPETCNRMRQLGAELEMVTEMDETGGYLLSRLHRVKELLRSSPNYVWTDQYNNPANPEAHYLSTAPEIYQQMGGKVDAVFVAVSTGGTLAGVGRYFREVSPQTKVIAVDASGSVIFGGLPGRRKLTGIGSSRKSDFITPDLYDCHIAVTDQQAFSMCREVAVSGIRLGGSSGAVFYACVQYLASHPEIKTAVCLCADGAENYESTIFNDEWMRQNGFLAYPEIPQIADVHILGEGISELHDHVKR